MVLEVTKESMKNQCISQIHKLAAGCDGEQEREG